MPVCGPIFKVAFRAILVTAAGVSGIAKDPVLVRAGALVLAHHAPSAIRRSTIVSMAHLTYRLKQQTAAQNLFEHYNRLARYKIIIEVC